MIKEFEYNSKMLGTECSLSIVCISEILANKLYQIAENQIVEYENKFSRFLLLSELSILNKKKKMYVSKEFIEVVLKSQELFFETRGVFNPLIQVSRLGYDRNFTDLKDTRIKEVKDEDTPYDIDFSSVLIDKDNYFIRLNDGQKFDFGGFLKGYLAELIAKEIKEYSKDIKGVIVNLGGDIHTEGLDENGDKFIFDIYNPINENESIKVTLFNQSLATSGTYKRVWNNDNEKIHHILDKKGLRNPQSDIVSSSIICEDGARSEAYAKVFLSISYEKVTDFLKDENISFVLIKSNGQIIKNIK